MASKYQLLQVLLLIIWLSCYQSFSSQCNTCNSVNKLACYSINQTQACDASNIPIGAPFSCPSEYVCVTGATGVLCEPYATSLLQAACQDCFKCDRTNTFACTGTSSFALCLGTRVLNSNATGTCGASYVCNIDYPKICGLQTQGINPTCSYNDDNSTTTSTTTSTTSTTTTTTDSTITTSSTTTVATTIDPATYCGTIQTRGRYPVGIDPNSTCRQYIYCALTNSIWIGQLYECPGNTYFNSSSQYCVTSLPAQCSVGVSSLNLYGFDLS